MSNTRRSRIEKYWGVDCYDFYGLSEIFGPIAGECKEKSGLHLAADYLLVEVVDPCTRKEVREGEVGVAVYTTLWNKAAPLLRYWSDDYVSISWEKCKCGRTSPRIFFEGRPFDGVTIDGKWIFAKEVEDSLLSFDGTGDEWDLKIQGSAREPVAKLQIESMGSDASTKQIEEGLADLLGIPVKAEIVPRGFFSRGDLKPRRMIDQRSTCLKRRKCDK